MGEVGVGWVAEPIEARHVAPPHVLQLQDGRLGMVTGVTADPSDGTLTITARHGDQAPWTWGPIEPTRQIQVLVRRDVLAGEIVQEVVPPG